MNTYEVFTDKNSVIVQSESILKALEKVEGTVLAIMEVGFRDEVIGGKGVEQIHKYYKPPFWYDAESGGYVFDQNGTMIMEVRGWGHLCSKLDDDEAWKVQEEIGKSIVSALNSLVSQPVTQSSELLEALKDVHGDPGFDFLSDDTAKAVADAIQSYESKTKI